MSANLINIAKDDTKSVYADAAAITAFTFDPEREEMSIYTAKGQLMYIAYKSFNIDPDDLIAKLEQAGKKMLYFPTRYEDKEHPHYVSPDAVTFATLTGVNSEGVQGAIIGVQGLGRIESYKAKPEEVDALLKAAVDGGAQMQKFTPDIAYARWGNPAALYIDSRSVTQIKDSGYGQIDVNFVASGSLDVQTGRNSSKHSQLVSEIANRLWQENPGAYQTLNEVFKEAEDQVKSAEDKVRSDFLDKIASGNPSLTKVPGTANPLYITPEDYAYISFHDVEREGKTFFTLSLNRQKTATNQYPEAIQMQFSSAAKRKAAFEAIQKASAAPAKHRQKRRKAADNPSP